MNVAILGLGIIGSAWANNLKADGLSVRGWNRTPKPGMDTVDNLAEAVADASYIFVVVADPPAVQSVLDQICPLISANQIVIQSSTISAEFSRQFARQVESTGAHFLEAPFTGSKPAAEQRKTVFYAGGSEAVLELARPVLERLSSAILHIGPVGSASSLKLAMNVNIAGVTHALCESLALCRAEGISDETFFDALHLNASRSGLSDLKEPKLREHDFAPQFSVKHLLKDLRLAQATAAAAGLKLPHVASLVQLYETAAVNGWADDDFISLIKLIK